MLNLRIPLKYKNMLIDMVDDIETKREIKYKAADVMESYPLKYRMKITLNEEGLMTLRFIYKIKTKFDWNSLLEDGINIDRKIMHHSLSYKLNRYGRERFNFNSRHFGDIEVLTMKVKVKDKVNYKNYYKDILLTDPDYILLRDLERLAISNDSEETANEMLRGILLYYFIIEILANVIVYQRDTYFEDLRIMEVFK